MNRILAIALIASALIGLAWVLRFYGPVFHVEFNEADGCVIFGYERR